MTDQPSGLTREQAKAETIAICVAPKPVRRIILLSGDRQKADGVFHMEATIFAHSNGQARGEILWTNVNSPWVPADMACSELVRGNADGIHLELQGYQIEPPLISEGYRITLYGAEAVGVFRGVCCFRGKWDARLTGTYQVVFERE